MQATTPPRCLGAMIRKPRVWPPRWSRTPSEAPKLARRPRWQPAAWTKAQLIGSMLCLWLLQTVPTPATAQTELESIGAGTLLFHDETGESIEAPRLHTDVRMEVTGIVARVEVRQRFSNTSDRWVEGIYAFPLPENSAIDRLRMEIGERVIVGELREKAQAQKLYEQARENGQRASVVHQNRPNLFRTAVANIGPHETVDVTIGYLQIVDQEAGRYSLRFPLTITPRYVPGIAPDKGVPLSAETPVASVSPATSADDTATLGDLHPALRQADSSHQSVRFDIDLDAGADLRVLKSTYHAIKADIQGSRARVQLAKDSVTPDRDFELAWMPVVYGEPATAVFRERTDAGEHILLMFMPPHEGITVATPREMIFVIDTSGSMAGQSIEQARAALLKALDTLRPTDRFTVIQFNSTYHCLFADPVPATYENLSNARRYVRALRSNGGTEMFPALSRAFSMNASGEHLRQIVFITDGAVGNEDQLMRLIRQRLGTARLFTVGIGSAPNGHFMRKAAQMGRGTFTFIGSANEVDERISILLSKLAQPVLTDIELQWPDGIQPEYAPERVGDLYAGEPVVITARLQGEVRGVLGLSGQANAPWMRQISLHALEPRSGIATLWARNRIGDLMDTRANGASEDSIRAQVLPLALEYQLVSKYTSLIAVDRTPARPKAEALHAKRLANTKPQGLDWPVPGYPSTATPAQLHAAIGALLLLLATVLWHLQRRRSANCA